MLCLSLVYSISFSNVTFTASNNASLNITDAINVSNISISSNSINIYNFTFSDARNWTHDDTQNTIINNLDTYEWNVTNTQINTKDFIHSFRFNHSGSLLTNWLFNSYDVLTNELNLFYTSFGTEGNKTWTWNKLGYIAQEITFPFSYDAHNDNTYNISEAIINVNIYDKTTLQLINGTNFTLQFVASVGATTTTITGTKTISNLLFQNEQYTLIVSANNYETEQAIFNFNNQENITLNIYISLTNATNLGYVRVKAINLIGQVISGAVVQALQWDSSSSSYIKVSETQTSEDGIGILNVILNDKYYIFRAYTTLSNAVNSTPQVIATVENGKTIELTLQDTSTEIKGLLQGVITTITENYDENTLQSNITFVWINTYGGALTPCINVYRINGINDRTIASSSCATPASSGTLLKSYTINSSYDYVIVGEYLLSNGNYLEMKSFIHYGELHISNLITNFGLQYYILILIFILAVYIILEKSILIGTIILSGISGLSIFIIPTILSKSILAFVMFICIAIVITIIRGDK